MGRFDNAYVFIKEDFIGGTDGCLDQVDGLAGGKDAGPLADGDVALVFKGGNLDFYVLDVDSGQTADGYLIIAPATNPGNKRWIHFGSVSAGSYHSWSTLMTSWATGLSSATIWKTQLQAGEKLTPTLLELIKKTGSPEEGLNIDIYDVTNDTVLWSTYSYATGDATQSGAGALIAARITNSTGSAAEAAVNLTFKIE